MTNIQAAIGLAQMENIERFLAKRLEIAGWYDQHLKGIPGIALPVVKEYAEHSWWMYSVTIEASFGMSRDEIMVKLAELEVETRPFFYPMHTMPVYHEVISAHLACAENVAEKGINLPTYYGLEESDVTFLVSVLKRAKESEGEK